MSLSFRPLDLSFRQALPKRLGPAGPHPIITKSDTREPSGTIKATSAGSLRIGHSNGHHKHTRPALPSVQRQLHQGLAHGSGGLGHTGGSSFRSSGHVTFHGPQHVRWQPDTATAAARRCGAGAASFRGPGSASFRAAPCTLPPPQPHTATASRAPAAQELETHAAVVVPRAGSGNADSASGAGSVSFQGQQGDTGARAVRKTSKLQETLDKLKELGLAGVVAYGLLNTLYYSCTFLFVWIYVAKVPQGQGIAAAAKSFLTVFGTVWAGSQVTKLARAAGALMMAPVVDKVLDKIQHTLKLKSKQQAFGGILVVCIGIALAIFGSVVAAWA